MLAKQAFRRLPVAHWAKPSRLFPSALRSIATPAAPPSPNDPFANGTNAYYAEEMYRHWRQDPKSVHVSWDVYFSGLDKGIPSSQAFRPPPSLPTPADGAPALHVGGGAELDDHLKVELTYSCFVISNLSRSSLGAITSSSISSAWASRCRIRPPWNSGCRPC
jgi:2-oxoglutarate dehydrogenase E1 component